MYTTNYKVYNLIYFYDIRVSIIEKTSGDNYNGVYQLQNIYD